MDGQTTCQRVSPRAKQSQIWKKLPLFLHLTFSVVWRYTLGFLMCTLQIYLKILHAPGLPWMKSMGVALCAWAQSQGSSSAESWQSFFVPATHFCLGVIALLTDHITVFEHWEILPLEVQKGWKPVLVKWRIGVGNLSLRGPSAEPKGHHLPHPWELQHLANMLTWETTPWAALLPRAEISKSIFSPRSWPFLGSFKQRSVCARVQTCALA